METFFLILLGCVIGYIVRGWFTKRDESYDDVSIFSGWDEDLSDIPEWNNKPIRPIYSQYPPKNENSDFEQVWVREHVYRDYDSPRGLSDDDYIAYHIWEKQNSKAMYAKHLPNAIVISGNPKNVVFHGGCLRCNSQELHGIDRCRGCQYFRAEWGKPDLSTN